MSKDIKTKDIDVIVVCGGKGERLQTVLNDRPKPMAEIRGLPFLDILLDYTAGFGFRRFILCICHKGDFIKDYYSNKNLSFTVLFSEEKKPLGTAGAIKNAEPLIKSNPFLVMNGDSICKLDLNEFINFHIRKMSLFSIVLSNMKDTDDYGRVSLDNLGKVVKFNEKIKSKSRDNLVNAGIYLLDRSIFSEIPENKKCSIEYEVFPKITKKRFYGFVTSQKFIDIGTPEKLKQANLLMKSGG